MNLSLSFARATALDLVEDAESLLSAIGNAAGRDELAEMVIAGNANIWREYVTEMARSIDDGLLPLDVEACLAEVLSLAEQRRAFLKELRPSGCARVRGTI